MKPASSPIRKVKVIFIYCSATDAEHPPLVKTFFSLIKICNRRVCQFVFRIIRRRWQRDFDGRSSGSGITQFWKHFERRLLIWGYEISFDQSAVVRGSLALRYDDVICLRRSSFRFETHVVESLLVMERPVILFSLNSVPIPIRHRQLLRFHQKTDSVYAKLRTGKYNLTWRAFDQSRLVV